MVRTNSFLSSPEPFLRHAHYVALITLHFSSLPFLPVDVEEMGREIFAEQSVNCPIHISVKSLNKNIFRYDNNSTFCHYQLCVMTMSISFILAVIIHYIMLIFIVIRMK